MVPPHVPAAQPIPSQVAYQPGPQPGPPLVLNSGDPRMPVPQRLPPPPQHLPPPAQQLPPQRLPPPPSSGVFQPMGQMGQQGPPFVPPSENPQPATEKPAPISVQIQQQR